MVAIFEIPLLKTLYKRRLKQLPSVVEITERLNYGSMLMLFLLAIILCGKQHFGKPLHCWSPKYFNSAWEGYISDYCFVTHNHRIEPNGTLFRLKEHWSQEQSEDTYRIINYYPWIPVALALQGLIFYLPFCVYSWLNKIADFSMEHFLEEALNIQTKKKQRIDKDITPLVTYLWEYLRTSRQSGRTIIPRVRQQATFVYLTMKILSFAVVIGQIIFINYFFNYGYNEWRNEGAFLGDAGQSEVFPFTMICDFWIRAQTNIQRYTVQCVIMVNLILQKVYFFLYIWLIVLCALNALFLLSSLHSLFDRRRRVKSVRVGHNAQDMMADMGPRGLQTRVAADSFIWDYLGRDGVLVISLVDGHIGSKLADELTDALFALYLKETKNNRFRPSGSEKDTISTGASLMSETTM